jgi:hypothetical protein
VKLGLASERLWWRICGKLSYGGGNGYGVVESKDG